MPKEKKLSYLKCGRCRRDRQKCVPINRVESARCDRCIRYDYACSPGKTRAEENMAAAGGAIIPNKPLKCTKQCLQEMSDLRHLCDALIRVKTRYISNLGTIAQLRSRFYSIIEESTERTRRFRNEGNWSEADIISRRIIQAMLTSDQILAPKATGLSGSATRMFIPAWSATTIELHFETAAIQENIGDFAAAEEIYESLIIELSFPRFLVHSSAREDDLHIAIHNLVRLYSLFRQRVVEMDIFGDNLPGYFHQSLSFIYVFHRASIINSRLLDEALLNSFWKTPISPRESLLLFASATGSSVMVQSLLDKDFPYDLEARFADEWTALHCVVDRGWSNIARALLEKGANVNCRNNLRETPLHFAMRTGQKLIASLLLHFEADVGAQDQSGRTPQSYASPAVSLYLEQLLMERARLNLRNSYKLLFPPNLSFCQRTDSFSAEQKNP